MEGTTLAAHYKHTDFAHDPILELRPSKLDREDELLGYMRPSFSSDLPTRSPSHRTHPPPETCAEALIYLPKIRPQTTAPKREVKELTNLITRLVCLQSRLIQSLLLKLLFFLEVNSNLRLRVRY